MNYSESLTYLNSFYDLEKTMLLPSARRWKLKRMRCLLEIFGCPQNNLLSVVIVGTKGKGSTGFFLQSILNKAGISSGFYSSPHLESPRERIRIHGKMISAQVWSRLLGRIKKKLDAVSPDHRFGYTYFEIMTLMATLAFEEAGVEAAIFEAGMGGRLDAVNALGAPIIIVTPIHLDHQEFLGNTIARIAAEKAAVIHSKADVIMARQLTPADRIIRARTRQKKARLWRVIKKTKYSLGLQGDHQVWNASAALAAAEIVTARLSKKIKDTAYKQQRFSAHGTISAAAIQSGLAAKDWPGRFEVFQGRPTIILDGAHNAAAMKVLVKTVQRTQAGCTAADLRRKILIFGVTRDKDSQEMLKILAQFFPTVILVPLKSPRGKSVRELLQEARGYYPTQIPAGSLKEALSLGKRLAGPAGTVVVTGSFYLVGEARAQITRKKERTR